MNPALFSQKRLRPFIAPIDWLGAPSQWADLITAHPAHKGNMERIALKSMNEKGFMACGNIWKLNPNPVSFKRHGIVSKRESFSLHSVLEQISHEQETLMWQYFWVIVAPREHRSFAAEKKGSLTSARVIFKIVDTPALSGQQKASFCCASHGKIWGYDSLAYYEG